MKSFSTFPSRPTLIAIASALLFSGCAINPKPITQAERASTLKEDRRSLYTNQEAVAGPLTLEEAIARTIKYNLENRVKLMEQALSLGQIDLARYDMLPKLVANAGYVSRNNELVSDSINVDTREIALGNTTSQERTRNTADLNFTWNALDFGVSYFQAHQQADRALILAERQRKTMHQLMQQVRQAYWLAVGAQALEGQVAPLLFDVRQALADAEAVEREKLRPPLETLNYRKAMLDVVRQLESMRDELLQAKPRLAALMNLPPATPFQLAAPAGPLVMPKLPLSLEQMEEKALLQRPELIEADLQERISVLETKKALVRMLPGVEIFAGPHYDSNKYLHNNNWADAGLRVTWNLFNILSGPQQIRVAENQLEVSRMQRLALNIAVLTQVHVAWRDYNGRERQYELAQQMFDIDAKIHHHTKAAVDSDAQNKLNQIRSGVSALMSEYRRYQNYAAMQASYGQLQASLGLDPLPTNGIAERPVVELSALLKQSMHGEMADKN
jgi:outer membrane protein TolC